MRKPGRRGHNERKYEVLSYAKRREKLGVTAADLAAIFRMKYKSAHKKLRDIWKWRYLKEVRAGLYQITDRGLDWLIWYENELKRKRLRN